MVLEALVHENQINLTGQYLFFFWKAFYRPQRVHFLSRSPTERRLSLFHSMSGILRKAYFCCGKRSHYYCDKRIQDACSVSCLDLTWRETVCYPAILPAWKKRSKHTILLLNSRRNYLPGHLFVLIDSQSKHLQGHSLACCWRVYYKHSVMKVAAECSWHVSTAPRQMSFSFHI